MKDPRKITEKQFQEQLRKAALIHGWRYYHPWLSIHSTGGYPDCTLLHAKKRRLIFVELKADGKDLRPDQQAWIDDLRLLSGSLADGRENPVVDIEVYVWHPSDIDEIWEILRR